MSTKKDEIIKRATLLFMQKGFSNVTMQQIADDSHVSRGGLYHHYKSTNEIMEDIIINYKMLFFKSQNVVTNREEAISWVTNYFEYEKERLSSDTISFQMVIHEYVQSLPLEIRKEKWYEIHTYVQKNFYNILEYIVCEDKIENIYSHIQLLIKSFSFYAKVNHFSISQFEFEQHELLDMFEKYKIKEKNKC